MVDLKTLDEETLYKVWLDCNENRWPDAVGRKPDGFDGLIEEKRWHHIFAKRAKQDYLHPISMAAMRLMPQDFFETKMKEVREAQKNEEYSHKGEADKIFFLCYWAGLLKWREKKAIREYCSKYPG